MQEVLALAISVLMLTVLVRVCTYSKVMVFLVGLPICVLIFVFLISL